VGAGCPRSGEAMPESAVIAIVFVFVFAIVAVQVLDLSWYRRVW